MNQKAALGARRGAVSLFGFVVPDFSFLSSFMFTSDLRGRSRELPHTTPPRGIVSPIIHLPDQGGTFVTTDERSLTHDDHPKSTAGIRVRSWCCPFSGFGQTYDNMYPLLSYCIEYFQLPKKPLWCSPLPPTCN